MAEFKISRLRFTWVGEWQDQTFYNTDEIVQFEGKAYVCLIPHTSNGFYNDLENIEPRWVLMMTGQTWKGVWQPFTFYSLDNIVLFGGIVYKCNAQHLSGIVLDTDLDKWDVYAESKTWQSEWTSSTTYGVGAIVQYGSSVYECTVSHVSASTDLEGLESDYNPDDSTLTKWKLVKEGVTWRGDYAKFSDDSSVLRYKLGDIVKYGPTLYKCVIGHAPKVATDDYSSQMPLEDTFDASKWEEWLPGLSFDGLWNPDSLYQPGDIVLYGGYLYTNKVINNVNIKPSFNSQDSTDAWKIITKAFDVQGAWNSTTEYKVGSVITYGDDVYVALLDNTGEVPGNKEVSVTYNSTGSSGATLKVSNTSDIRIGMTVIGEGFAEGQSVVKIIDSTTLILNKSPNGTISNGSTLIFAGTNAPFWELLIPGASWEGKWEENKLYNQDDIAYFGNATYKCIREHTSSLVTRPDVDFNRNFWVIYLQHFQGNILTDLGQMIVRDDEKTTTLSIGADTNVLKVIEGLPVWGEIFFTPAVYYVADNGIDSPDRGTTWDIPWRTIKYACESVKEGALNPEAKILLRENKRFIVEEAFYWMKLQQQQGIQPFDQITGIDDEKTLRDLEYIVDAVIYDLIRGGNSQTVAATLAYFDLESTNRFTNPTVAEQVPVYILVLAKLFEFINYALRNQVPVESYQSSPAIEQYFNNSLIVPEQTLTVVGALENIILTALSEGSPENVPPANQGLTTTINIKSGTFEEELPIVVPANAAINGDELRGVVVKPKNPVNTLCTRTIGSINQFVVGSTLNMHDNTPVQFVSLNPVTETSTIIGGPNVIAGKTYYVIGSSITDTTFQVSEEPNGEPVSLLTNIGFMYVYGGTALSDMFYVQNGTGIRNITCTGLLGTLTEENEYLTRRPTGGAYVSLDPGEGPEDTSAWIIRKSPYVQNVTNFGFGCVGLKIDSTLHNGGNRSIVCNDFTQIISDGIGIWCTGGDALCEAVSVFSYYNYAGYFSEDGGRIRATNGNSSYGTYGVVAEGFDPDEIPATGIVNNKSTQASAAALSALGANAEILRIQYDHAGEEYFTTTTNLLKQSNNLLSTANWQTDGNIVITRAATSPFENAGAWRVQASTSLTDSSYLYQFIDVSPQGRSYTNITGENLSGSGSGATFDVTVFSDRYVVSVNSGGSGYVVGNQIRLSGKNFGGQDGLNDVFITVSTLSITAILTIDFQGTVPEGSNLPYTFSIFGKKGSAQYIDLYAIFTGYDTKTSNLRFNFDTLELSTFVDEDGGIVPSEDNRGIEVLEDGWYRIWFTTYDETAQNTQLECRVYPRGIDGLSGVSNLAGAQLSVGYEGLTFYLDTQDDQPTAYADISIQGAGSGVRAIADELRSGSVFETRILENSAFVIGGVGYRTQTNNAQTGTDEFLTLAQSEIAEAPDYERMRISISSGRGAGQYGIISKYDPITKRAFVLKESFDQLEIISTDSSSNRFKLGQESDINTIFRGQKIQFIPTFYEVLVTETSQNSVEVLATEGNLNNIITVSSTARLRENMAINFSGETFGGVITDFTYYILTIIDETRIQISTSLGGGIWPLNTENLDNDSNIIDTDRKFNLNFPANTGYLIASSTDDMEVTFPIQFTGNSIGGVELGFTYYIHDIYDGNNFSISSSKVEIPITATSDSNDSITTDDTSGLIPMNPIVFKGLPFGNLSENTRYYVNSIIDGTNFTIASSVLTRTVTATQAVTNLITVDSTSGFIPNSPIVFTGTTFGNIVNDRVYYIQVINSATTFTISDAPGGAATTLTTATGQIIARTTADTVEQTTALGTMTGIAPGQKEQLSAGSGRMNAAFFTEIFGGISQGTTYYILDIFNDTDKEFTITATEGGSTPVQLDTATGSMQIGAVGWDHINPGTPLVNLFDSTSVYSINPRIVYSDPPFIEEDSQALALTDEYIKIVSNGFAAIAIPKFGDQVLVLGNFDNWTPSVTLPVEGTEFDNGGWVDSTYGKTAWVILSASGEALVSVSDGASWITRNLPELSNGVYSAIAYGNGRFVAIADGTNESAYSTNLGSTWAASTDSVSDTDEWIDIAYGNNTFVAISRGSNTAKYSKDGGETWSETLLDNSLDSTINNWTQVEFGNGRFVAVASNLRSSAYSFDGVTWYNSNIEVEGTMLEYGQGVFVLIAPNSSNCYITEDGFNWKLKQIISRQYSAIGFSFNPGSKVGKFYTLSSEVSGTIRTGARTKGSARVDSGSIISVSMWETGSGYTEAPQVQIIDPNNSTDANLQPRIGNGTLGAPSFVSQGSGYNTNSTQILINGDGFADKFQIGLRLITRNVTRLPGPGDNLEFEGNSIIYRVANTRILKGTSAPNLEVEIQLSPQLTEDTSPSHDTAFTLRSRFSQVRLTNHDFLNIGFGNELQSNYPGLPERTGLEPQDEVIETNNGRVFYSSTDQDGNFRVGDLFAVEQATGIVTLNASEFGLEGLAELEIGGVALGGSPVTITQFSTDGTFVANSNNIVPTQRAIRTYLASRLSQGGSDTFTGLLTAGTVKIGGPDEIDSTVTRGAEGWVVKIPVKANFAGPTAAWAGDGLAMSYFMKTFVDPTREQM